MSILELSFFLSLSPSQNFFLGSSFVKKYFFKMKSALGLLKLFIQPAGDMILEKLID